VKPALVLLLAVGLLLWAAPAAEARPAHRRHVHHRVVHHRVPLGGSRAPGQVNGHACGEPLPPCWVLRRESGGDIRSTDPRSTASGKWAFLNGTWGNFGGYHRAMYAPESVQDEKARLLWNHGRGCSHWSAC